MTRPAVLVDTGPIVAIIQMDDKGHQVCAEALTVLKPPLLTTWPVITECCWLLRKKQTSIRQLFQMLASGFLEISEIDRDGISWISTFMMKYGNVGAQLADASIMYFAEREDIETVFTLDRRDFSIYRIKGKRRVKIIPSQLKAAAE